MRICGLKLTHDGAVAIIEDGKLISSVEIEKIDNNERYSEIINVETIEAVVNKCGYDISSIDIFAIDGWGGNDAEELAIQPRLEIGERHNTLTINKRGRQMKLGIGQYHENCLQEDVAREWIFDGLMLNGEVFPYRSYNHLAGHILSAYCTSPFANRAESAYVLIWDGGTFPRLYYFDSVLKKIENLGPIFLLIGNIYTIFSQHFGPFKVVGNFAKDDLSVAGKVMAYVACGEKREELYGYFDSIYQECYSAPMGFANVFANEFKRRTDKRGFSDEDILRTFHEYLSDLIVEKLKKKIDRFGKKSGNLCFAGGCALNIKWNSAIRQSGLFDEVYVPPFPNDSGSAIGAACCARFVHNGQSSLKWNIYSGPQIVDNGSVRGWQSKKMTIKSLAKLLHETDEPVVILSGRAELGPRALGKRSIICTATCTDIKDILNKIKSRENYRPISPICLESRAEEIFDPGTKDPFMIFDHQVKQQWRERIPAVVHTDGTARLQTVSNNDNAMLYQLLGEYEKLSGIPVLCNTSANFKNRGFFPDAQSAMEWGRVNYVWCDGFLHEKIDKISFHSNR